MPPKPDTLPPKGGEAATVRSSEVGREEKIHIAAYRLWTRITGREQMCDEETVDLARRVREQVEELAKRYE